MKRKNLWVQLAVLGALGAFGSIAVQAADPGKINWSKVPAVKVGLFYPGQSSYEWLISKDHDGASKVKRGDSCVSCHDEKDAERELGASLVAGGPLEPMPVKGKDGYKDLKVQAAYDSKNVYLRFQWQTLNAHPGTEHQYLRFDGKEWKVWGFPKLDKIVQDGKMQAIYEDRMSVMLDDGKVPGFDKQGCWLSCHDGQRDMPKQFTKSEIEANALMKAIKRNDVRKYLPATRTDPSDWKSGKTVEEINRIKADGGFVELFQWRAHRSYPVGMADDGYVLDYRLVDAGKGPFTWNVDRKTMTPKFMFDAAKVGAKALALEDVGNASKPHALIREDNAVAYDPAAGWKKGDVLPGRLLSRADASGSAADNADVRGEWVDGQWTVLWTRKLDTGHAADDKALKPGSVVNVGFAVHDDNVTTRFHHVSFPLTLGVGTKGTISSVALE